jgi:hypothetical protein
MTQTPLTAISCTRSWKNLLYRARNAFASAPDEYDQACRDHDGEMDAIRQAFMAKWGQVPVLEAYRQMAIRQQKVGNLEQARGGRSEALLSTGTTPLAQKPPRIYADGQPATGQSWQPAHGLPIR